MRIASRLLFVSLPIATVGACQCEAPLHPFPGELDGLICNAADGQAMKDGKVTITDGSGVKIEITTAADGTFKATKVGSGSVTVDIHDAGGDRKSKVFVEAGKTAHFADGDCHPAPPPPGGEVDGCVCDEASGTRVSAANVFVVDPASGGVFSTGTDANGCFQLTNVAPGAQTVKVQKGTFFTSWNTDVVAGQTVDVGQKPTDACTPPPPPASSGTVKGEVCSSDGQTWLAGATVSCTRADGTVATTTTDSTGAYSLTGVPTGQQTLDITKGSFSTSITVNVVADQTTTVPADQCSITNPAVKIAVVTGEYDDVQQVLTDLGVSAANVTTYDGVSEPSVWNPNLLDDYATLSQYQIVFLNCGLDDNLVTGAFGQTDSAGIANLKQFVQNGGSVYASDWAYSVIETAWPNEIDFYGTDNAWDAFSAGSPKQGSAVDGLAGNIVDANLAAGMGGSSIALDYKLNEWVVMQSVAPDVTVYIRAPAPALLDGNSLADTVHTVGFAYGAGHVLYTSFHQEPGVNQAQERVLQLLMFTL